MITKQNYVTLVVPILVAVLVVVAIAYAGASARRYDRLYRTPGTASQVGPQPLRERLSRLVLGLSDGGRVLIRAAAVVGPMVAAALWVARNLRD